MMMSRTHTYAEREKEGERERRGAPNGMCDLSGNYIVIVA